MSSYLTVAPNIVICPNQPPEFVTLVKEALVTIGSKPVGKRLLDKIGKARHTVWIIEGKEAQTKFYTTGSVTRGIGSDAEMRLTRAALTRITEQGRGIDNPFFVVLAHELVHVYHGFYGKHKHLGNVVCKRLWHDDEEYHAIIGFPSNKNKQRTQPKITENAIREEHHLPKVYTHLPAESLAKPELANKIQYQCLAHRTTTAMLQLLATPEFLENSSRLFCIDPNDATDRDVIKRLGEKEVVVTTNPHTSPPILGTIHQIDRSLEHRTTTTMLQLLATPEFLENPNRLYFNDATERDVIKRLDEKVVVATNPQASCPNIVEKREVLDDDDLYRL